MIFLGEATPKKGRTPPNPGHSIYVQNCKGGAGKTALSMYLTLLCSSFEEKVLAVDADTSCGFTVRAERGYDSEKNSTFGVFEICMGKRPAGIIPIEIAGGGSFDLVPGNISFGRESEGYSIDAKKVADKVELSVGNLAREYNRIIFDGAPILGKFDEILMATSDIVVIPGGIDYASVFGIVRVLVSLKDVCEKIGRISPYVFLAPWGIQMSKKTEEIMEAFNLLADEQGFRVFPVFPPVPDMTDLLFDCGSMEAFMKHPVLTKRKKILAEFGNIVYDTLLSCVPAERKLVEK